MSISCWTYSYFFSDRNRSIHGDDYLKNYNMAAAGGALNLDPTSRKLTVNDGKSRLFGFQDENQYSGGEPQQKINTGKRIL